MNYMKSLIANPRILELTNGWPVHVEFTSSETRQEFRACPFGVVRREEL